MPVRSLTSSVIKWPDAVIVDQAARGWAQRVAALHPEVLRIAYFGSYARGDWGVGSDLDLMTVVQSSNRPFAERPLDFDLSGLPVPAEAVIYTPAEWKTLAVQSPRFYQTLEREAVTLFERT
jgi:predicted nucleotidyltransferase